MGWWDSGHHGDSACLLCSCQNPPFLNDSPLLDAMPFILPTPRALTLGRKRYFLLLGRSLPGMSCASSPARFAEPCLADRGHQVPTVLLPLLVHPGPWAPRGAGSACSLSPGTACSYCGVLHLSSCRIRAAFHLLFAGPMSSGKGKTVDFRNVCLLGSGLVPHARV